MTDTGHRKEAFQTAHRGIHEGRAIQKRLGLLSGLLLHQPQKLLR